MSRRRLPLLLSALVLLLRVSAASAGGDVVLSDAWIAELPPGSPVRAAYMDVRNTGDTDVALLAVTGADFERIELHKTVMKGEMVSMARLHSLVIPANESVSLRPGAAHLMLFGSQRALVEGDEARLEFRFSDGSVLVSDLPVRRYDAARNKSGHKH